ncbi:putative tape measure protein [uncultured Mediterranean phage uvMED]|nr:putative tape measure protein [uncultured Mediterranean phage uvMED]BAQ91742.1 putative tape measure protein [uncultured Mediterranean phage uvMED]BAR20485.1 putative tape measure protein [uncultured Mediterranean phage uvMED]
MATKQVNIDIIAKDKTRQAMSSATKGVDGLKSSVFNLKNALIGLGAGVAIKSFIDVGKSVESLQIRLKFLFGSVEEGAKAFDVMSKFASKVPFSLEQIQAGAGNLAVVAKDADELAKILEITGNVASVTGLDFRTTAEQIQRSLSAGVASADIFRERGVRDLLGFKAGATVTAKETAEAFERVFGKNGRFAGATKDLAGTLEGTLSMIGDKFFNFQKSVAESFFVGLKSEFGALDKALEENEDVIQKVAKAVGKGLSDAVIMAGKAIGFLQDNFEILKAIGMGVIVFKITKAFLSLAVAIGKARLAMVAFSKLSKTTIIGIIAGLGIALAEATGHLDRFFAMFEKPKGLEDFRVETDLLISRLETMKHKGTDAFLSLNNEVFELLVQMEDFKNKLEPTDERLATLVNTMNLLRNAVFAVPLEKINVGLAEQTEQVGILTQAYDAFMLGFLETKDVFKEIENIGKATFGKLKTVLADFVMTGKLNMGDLAKFVVKSFIEMLIGQAVQFAFKKSMAMFKADAIKKAMISLYEGAMKTFASIPFPLNIVAVAGALAVGGALVNKIKGFEKGGRPPVGQPSIVGEKGAELFVPDQAGTVVPNDKLGGMGKAVTVNFNISTVDARGFNELLVNSRGTIVNLINSAVNEKGRMAII